MDVALYMLMGVGAMVLIGELIALMRERVGRWYWRRKRHQYYRRRQGSRG